ncbi:MAG: hypothetical protein Q9168_004596 [Polycauliona sp. 1 TL-2023]
MGGRLREAPLQVASKFETWPAAATALDTRCEASKKWDSNMIHSQIFLPLSPLAVPSEVIVCPTQEPAPSYRPAAANCLRRRCIASSKVMTSELGDWQDAIYNRCPGMSGVSNPTNVGGGQQLYIDFSTFIPTANLLPLRPESSASSTSASGLTASISSSDSTSHPVTITRKDNGAATYNDALPSKENAMGIYQGDREDEPVELALSSPSADSASHPSSSSLISIDALNAPETMQEPAESQFPSNGVQPNGLSGTAKSQSIIQEVKGKSKSCNGCCLCASLCDHEDLPSCSCQWRVAEWTCQSWPTMVSSSTSSPTHHVTPSSITHTLHSFAASCSPIASLLIPTLIDLVSSKKPKRRSAGAERLDSMRQSGIVVRWELGAWKRSVAYLQTSTRATLFPGRNDRQGSILHHSIPYLTSRLHCSALRVSESAGVCMTGGPALLVLYQSFSASISFNVSRLELLQYTQAGSIYKLQIVHLTTSQRFHQVSLTKVARFREEIKDLEKPTLAAVAVEKRSVDESTSVPIAYRRVSQMLLIGTNHWQKAVPQGGPMNPSGPAYLHMPQHSNRMNATQFVPLPNQFQQQWPQGPSYLMPPLSQSPNPSCKLLCGANTLRKIRGLTKLNVTRRGSSCGRALCSLPVEVWEEFVSTLEVMKGPR